MTIPAALTALLLLWDSRWKSSSSSSSVVTQSCVCGPSSRLSFPLSRVAVRSPAGAAAAEHVLGCSTPQDTRRCSLSHQHFTHRLGAWIVDRAFPRQQVRVQFCIYKFIYWDIIIWNQLFVQNFSRFRQFSVRCAALGTSWHANNLYYSLTKTIWQFTDHSFLTDNDACIGFIC